MGHGWSLDIACAIVVPAFRCPEEVDALSDDSEASLDWSPARVVLPDSTLSVTKKPGQGAGPSALPLFGTRMASSTESRLVQIYSSAMWPVMSRPTIRVWISFVPS